MFYLLIILLVVTVASVIMNLMDDTLTGASRVTVIAYGVAAICVYASYLRLLWVM